VERLLSPFLDRKNTYSILKKMISVNVFNAPHSCFPMTLPSGFFEDNYEYGSTGKITMNMVVPVKACSLLETMYFSPKNRDLFYEYGNKTTENSVNSYGDWHWSVSSD
jgi:hypothetical protein